MRDLSDDLHDLRESSEEYAAENGADKVAQRRRGQKGRRNQRGAPEVEEVRLDLHKDEDGWPES